MSPLEEACPALPAWVRLTDVQAAWGSLQGFCSLWAEGLFPACNQAVGSMGLGQGWLVHHCVWVPTVGVKAFRCLSSRNSPHMHRDMPKDV